MGYEQITSTLAILAAWAEAAHPLNTISFAMGLPP